MFHSDHGSIALEHNDASSEIAEKMDNTRVSGTPAWNMFRQAASVLLVKPPGASATPLAVSDRLTSLVDLPATIYGRLGLQADYGEGADVLGDPYDEKRTTDTYAGFIRKGEDGGILRFGNGILRGYFDHYGYSIVDGWAIREKIRVEW